jgi:hypothetical protein
MAILIAGAVAGSAVGEAAGPDDLGDGRYAYSSGAFVGVDAWESVEDSTLAFRGAFVVRYDPRAQFIARGTGEDRQFQFADTAAITIGPAKSDSLVRVSHLYSKNRNRKFTYAGGMIRHSCLLLCFANPDYGTSRDRPLPVYVGLGPDDPSDPATFVSIGADIIWQARAREVSSILHDFRAESVVSIRIAGLERRFLKGEATVERIAFVVLPNGTVAYPGTRLFGVPSVVLTAK